MGKRMGKCKTDIWKVYVQVWLTIVSFCTFLIIHLKSAMKMPNLELNCNNAVFCFLAYLGPIFSPKKSPKKNSAAFAIYGPKLVPKPLKLPKFSLMRTENRRKLCDPSKELQCTKYMGCSQTCTPLKWPEGLKKNNLCKTRLFLAILR